MAKKNISSIIFHLENLFAIKCLSDEKAGQLFKAILQYGYDESLPDFPEDTMQGLFAMYQVQIDRDKANYAETCERNKRNAESRYKKNTTKNSGDKVNQVAATYPSRIHSDTTACDGIQTNAPPCLYNNNSKDNNKNNDDDSKDVIINEAKLTIARSESEYTFDKIWAMYGKPIGDTEILKGMWNSLPEIDKEAIFAYVPQYVQTREERFRKNFMNFLIQKTWKNEPIKQSINETNISTNAPNRSRGENTKIEAMELMQEFIADNQPMQVTSCSKGT